MKSKEIAIELEQLKQQLGERERRKSYELGLFGGEFCFDRC